MRVIYSGPHTEVTVDATGHVAKRDGDPIDVPDEIGRSLIEQDTWSEAKAQKPKHEPQQEPATPKQKD